MIKRLLTIDRKRHAFLFAVALVVAWVRNVIQYRRFTFDTAWELFGFWFVHYIGIALCGVVYFVALQGARRHLLDTFDSSGETKPNDALVQFFLAVLVIAVAAFLLVFWPHNLVED